MTQKHGVGFDVSFFVSAAMPAPVCPTLLRYPEVCHPNGLMDTHSSLGLSSITGFVSLPSSQRVPRPRIVEQSP